jgi:hypothetical protein
MGMKTIASLIFLALAAGCSGPGEMGPDAARLALVRLIENEHPGDTWRCLAAVRDSPVESLDDGWIAFGPARCHLQKKVFSISIIARNMAWFQNHYGRFVRVDGQWKAIVEGSQFGDALPESVREASRPPDSSKQ